MRARDLGADSTTRKSSATASPRHITPIRSGTPAVWEKGRTALVTKYIAQPGERIVWCLRRRASDVRCVLHPDVKPVEVHVVQDRDLVLTELFPEESIALKWSRAYAERLRAQGWHDSLDE